MPDQDPCRPDSAVAETGGGAAAHNSTPSRAPEDDVARKEGIRKMLALLEQMEPRLAGLFADSEVVSSDLDPVINRLQLLRSWESRAGCNSGPRTKLLSLGNELLHKIWPPECVLVGRAACVRLKQMMEDAPAVRMSIGMRALALQHVEANPAEAFADLLCRFRAVSLERKVDAWEAAACEASVGDLMLRGVQAAAARGWRGLSELTLETAALAGGEWFDVEDVAVISRLKLGLLPALASHAPLRLLNLSGCDLRGVGEERAVGWLGECSHVHTLRLASTRCSRAVLRAVQACSLLTHLDLSANNLGGGAEAESLGVLGGLTQLGTLRLRSAGLGEAEAEALGGVLPRLTSLTHLDLAHNFEREPRGEAHDTAPGLSLAVEGVLRGVGACGALATLDLGAASLAFHSLHALAAALAHLPRLEALDISGLRGTEAQLRGVWGALAVLPRLRSLRTCAAPMGHAGGARGRVLGEELRRLAALRALALHSLPAAHPPTASLAQALARGAGARLERLELHGGGSEGMWEGGALAALALCTALRSLRLAQAPLGEGACAELAGAVGAWGGLEELAVEECSLGPDGLRLLAPRIARLSRLQLLRLAGNGVGAAGVEWLGRGLGAGAAGGSVRLLDLACNRVEFRPRLLARLLAACSALTQLSLAGNPAVHTVCGLQEALVGAAHVPSLARLNLAHQDLPLFRPRRPDPLLANAAWQALPPLDAAPPPCAAPGGDGDKATFGDRAQCLAALAARIPAWRAAQCGAGRRPPALVVRGPKLQEGDTHQLVFGYENEDDYDLVYDPAIAMAP